jgi:hypothetical protein
MVKEREMTLAADKQDPVFDRGGEAAFDNRGTELMGLSEARMIGAPANDPTRDLAQSERSRLDLSQAANRFDEIERASGGERRIGRSTQPGAYDGA